LFWLAPSILFPFFPPSFFFELSFCTTIDGGPGGAAASCHTSKECCGEQRERDYSTLLCTLLISSTIIDVVVQFRTRQRSNTFLFLYQMAAANSDPSVLCWFLYIFVLRSPAPARSTSPNNFITCLFSRIFFKTNERR
jgi:hypothetical protein